MTDNYNCQSLNHDDTFILKSNLAAKYNQISKMSLFFGGITLFGFFLIMLRIQSLQPGYFFLAVAVLYCSFFLAFWFSTIARLKRDLKEKKKIVLTTRIKNKSSTNELGIREHYLLLEDNPFGLKKIDVTPEIFARIPLHTELKITATLHSGTFLQCEME
ncbi:hypothetical protein [Chitinophaga vietnamensis]|uniref:hypothetical protein n=1 Tax=Chitinophaga vietnamensis TaxID=2593957 RepID=UPI0011788F2F|nr:hypothetical protein [Chitinophaga vietnamensis]